MSGHDGDPERSGTRARRAAAACLALLLVAAAAAVGAGSGPAAATTPLARMTIASFAPTVGTAAARLQVSGTLQVGPQRLSNVRVSLLVSQTPVNSRAELAGVAAGDTTSKDGSAVASQQVADELPPGATASFDVGTELAGLRQLDQFGVYVVGIRVTASHGSGSGTVAITRTFLPWLPAKQEFRPTGFSWLWPLVAHPVRLSNDTFATDALAGELTLGGRLQRLVEAGEQLGTDVPLTWAIDPDLLDTVRRMTSGDGYTVLRRGREVRGTGASAADAWLSALRTATATSTVLSLPYADPDLVALRRGGLTGDIAASREQGAATAAAVLGRDVTSDVIWPPDGFIDRPTLALLRRTNAAGVVLDSRAQPPKLELNYTPSGVSTTRAGGGSITTLVADGGLTDLLGKATTAPVLSSQRFLAETAMITAELPTSGGGRVILVAPPRRWAPPQVFLDRLIDGIGRASWISGTGLESMRTTPPAEVERRAVQYPASVRRAELDRPYLTAMQSQHTRISVFAGVLTDPDALVNTLEQGVLRLESSWWRERTSRSNRLSRENADLAARLNSIHVQPGSYTFGSRSGTIPLTIANGVDQEVVVQLRLEPQQPRLRLRQPGTIRIGPNRKVQIPIKASAVAVGPVLVNANLYNPNGSPLSAEPVQLRIRITQYGTVALAITGVAAGVLFLAALLRLVRRARHGRRGAAPSRPRADHHEDVVDGRPDEGGAEGSTGSSSAEPGGDPGPRPTTQRGPAS